MLADPMPDRDVSSVTPAIVAMRFSSGEATLVAIVDGEPPGRLAETLIVGKSTCGSGETGITKKAATPDRNSPIVSNSVPIGRRMKGAERFMT